MKLWIKTVLFAAAFCVAASAEDTTFTSEHFSGSGNCAMCHNGLSDAQGNDVSIESAWASTMMANAAKDPLWRAKVRSEISRNPHLEEVINDKCTRCHAPMANTEAHAQGDAVKIFDDGFLNPANSHHDEALNGVSCTLCHQIEDNGKLGTLEGMSGHYEVGETRTLNGPYDNVFSGPMLNNVNYDIRYAAHVKESKLCATCHNLKTPYVDENGNVLSTTPESEFPEQMPYSEWEHSSYNGSQSCQDCHMQRTDGVIMASRPPWLSTVRDGFARHVFVGANKTMLDILRNNSASLGVTANGFDATIAKTDAMLQSAASLEFSAFSLENGTMDLELKIASETGHKLPSGFPSRRLFVHLKVTDGSGAVVFESGRVNADGSIARADSDADRSRFEPHYDRITSEDQVQIYEAVMGDNLGAVTYTLLRGMAYQKDNRLLPKGFDKTTASDDIKVVGNALEDGDFGGGGDMLGFRIAGLADGSYTVEAELLYQSVGYAFARDLFTDTSAETAAFKGMFDASAMKTSRIAAASLTLEGTGTLPACSDGIDNDGDGLVDAEDPGCSGAADRDETDAPAPRRERATSFLLLLLQ